MNDMKDLLDLALSDGIAPGPGCPANPAADLARGRRLLRRRRLAALGGATAAVVCGAAIPLALHGSGGAAARHAVAAHPPAAASHSSRHGKTSPKIALVAWEGTQPPGYRVSEMPKGWVVQGSGPYALVIAPPNDPDKSPDSFLGKLVVMLQSTDVHHPPAGTSERVNGRPGVFDVQDHTQILTFQVADGHWVVIQAPTSLGWDASELVKFASGVQVLVAAQPGHG